MVGEALRRIGKLEVDNPEVVPSPEEFHYRNRVTYTMRRLRGGRVVAGFRELGHRGRVLDLGSECLLPEDPLRSVWTRLREEWGPGARSLPRGRQLRLTLQKGLDGVGLLIRGGDGRGEPEGLVRGVDGLVSVWEQGKRSVPRLLAGEEVLRVGWERETLELSPGAFVQINAGMGSALYEYVLGEVGQVDGRRIIDAYCGPGILGRALAQRGGEVTGIDVTTPGALAPGHPESRGFSPVVGRVEKELKRFLPADLVLLNPPRGGLEESIPDILAAIPPEDVVYVSCDPATLARDLFRMRKAYRVARVRAFDLFPQTGHVETVVTLKRVLEDSQ
jgi:23S rRNA (uracil1939-C5)-methyltransferase